MANIGAKNREGPEGLPGKPGKQGEKGPKGQIGAQGLPGFTGQKGLRGPGWLSGKGIPEPSLGKINDHYLDILTGNVWIKTPQGWRLVLNIIGRPGTNETIITKRFKKGKVKVMYAEVILASLETNDILLYAVPNAFSFDAFRILVSGENIGTFSIIKVKTDLTEVVLAKVHVWWSDFNQEIELDGFTYLSGEKIKVVAENCRNQTGKFNATLIGDLYSNT